METIELNVAGMHCDGCENSLKRALGRIDGVLAVTADHEAGTVVVDAEHAIEREELARAVSDAGYEVVPDDDTRLPVIG